MCLLLSAGIFPARAHICSHKICFSVTTPSFSESGKELLAMTGCYLELHRDQYANASTTMRVEGLVLSPDDHTLVNAAVEMDTMDASGAIRIVNIAMAYKMDAATPNGNQARLNMELCASLAGNKPADDAGHTAEMHGITPYIYMGVLWALLYWMYYTCCSKDLRLLQGFLLLVYPGSLLLKWGVGRAVGIDSGQGTFPPIGPIVLFISVLGFIYFASIIPKAYIPKLQTHVRTLEDRMGIWGPMIGVLHTLYAIVETMRWVMDALPIR